MMAKCHPYLALSQNEKDAILEKEKKKWKAFRLQQVRAQSRNEAERIRESVKEEERTQKLKISNEAKKKWEEEKNKKIHNLEEMYLRGFQELGEAHKNAKVENDAMQAYEVRRVHDSKVAAERGKIARNTLDKEKAESSEKENVNRLQRNKIQIQEKKRAERMARLPTPEKFKAKNKTLPKIQKKVTFHEAGTFTTSAYVPTQLKIIKENDTDHISAKELAKKENEEYKLMEKIRREKEEENNRKIEERGNKARKREKTKELYSQLMKDLEEAEKDHILSDFLQGDDDVEGVKAELLSKNLGEKLSEAKVRGLLSQEKETAETVPINLSKPLSNIENISRLSREKEINFNVRDRTLNTGDMGVADETDKSQVLTQPLPKVGKEPLLTAPKNIHLRETVPVHEIPIVREKFLVKVLDDVSQMSTSTETSSDVSEMTKSDVSSFEELKIKIIVNPDSSDSSKESLTLVPNWKETMTSEATEYFQPPRDFKTKYVPKEKTLLKTRLSSSSSGATEYFDLPHSISSDSNFHAINKNIQAVQEKNERVRRLIEELNQLRDTSQGKTDRDLSAFKTPPRIYTEPLKSDSSSKRPVSKREKFDKYKKLILEHYVPLIILKKKEELQQITASTVNGSGISLSSERNISDLIKCINVSNEDSLVSSVPTITSDMLNNFNDLDIIPSKMRRSRPVTSDITRGSSSSTSNESLPETSTDEQRDKKTKILTRLLTLQRLKQKLLLQQYDLSQLDNEQEENSQLSSRRKMSKSSKESSIEWSSCNDYQTPTREVSTQEFSSFSPASVTDEHVDGVPRVTSSKTFDPTMLEKSHTTMDEMSEEMVPVKLMEYSSSSNSTHHSSRISQHSSTNPNSSKSGRSLGSRTQVPIQHELDIVNDSIQRLVSAMKNDKSPSVVSTPSDAENIPVSSSSSSSAPLKTSSSAPSIPDMNQILEKFGLCWASSMIKTMDKAEENNSSDDGTNK